MIVIHICHKGNDNKELIVVNGHDDECDRGTQTFEENSVLQYCKN